MTQSQKILVVDDNEDIRFAVVDSISKSFPNPILTSTSTDEAIDLLNKESTIGLVITDFQMPGKDGLELVKYLKSQEEPIPVILGTAHVLINDDIKKRGIFPDSVFIKPFDMDELLQTISSFLIRD